MRRRVAEVIYSSRALASLTNPFEYLQARNFSAARDFLLEIERTTGLLGEFPKLGRVVNGINLPYHVTRRFRYRPTYRAEEDRLEIRDVLHPSQNWPP